VLLEQLHISLKADAEVSIWGHLFLAEENVFFSICRTGNLTAGSTLAEFFMEGTQKVVGG